MGMSASQVRLLTITKRIHEVENEAERTQNQKMLLGLQSDEAYEEYLAAMEKKDIEYAWFNGNSGNFEWSDLDLTTLYNTVGSEYRLKVRNINHAQPYGPVTGVSATTQTQTFTIDTDADGNDYITVGTNKIIIPDSTADFTYNGVKFTHSSTGYTATKYNITLPNGSSITGYGDSDGNCVFEDDEHNLQFIHGITSGTTKYVASSPSTEEYVVCENLDQVIAALNITDQDALTDKVVFRDLVYNAYAIIESKIYDEDTQQRIWQETSVATNVGLREKTDDKELAIAEANYEAALRRIDKKEEQYDKDLAKYDQERKALTSQLETLKTCIKENIDRTFKIFQG